MSSDSSKTISQSPLRMLTPLSPVFSLAGMVRSAVWYLNSKSRPASDECLPSSLATKEHMRVLPDTMSLVGSKKNSFHDVTLPLLSLTG